MARGDEGVLVMAGSHSESFALFVRNGRLIFRYQHILDESASQISASGLKPGDLTVRYDFDQQSMTDSRRRGSGRLWLNEDEIRAARKLVRERHGYDSDGSLQRTFTGQITSVNFGRAHCNQGTGE
jgi:arylsulfatase